MMLEAAIRSPSLGIKEVLRKVVFGIKKDARNGPFSVEAAGPV